MNINPDENNDRLFLNENHLLKMDINDITDTKDFFIGVNNVANQISSNTNIIGLMESNSGICFGLDDNTIFGKNTNGLDLSNISKDSYTLTTPTYIDLETSEIIEFKSNVTTVLAYGKAVGNIFADNSKEIGVYNNKSTDFLKPDYSLGKTYDYKNTFETAKTQPIFFTPQQIQTDKILEKLPETKKELSLKTIQASEIIECAFNLDTKNDNDKITTTIIELKKAIKNIQSVSTSIFAQTTQSITVVKRQTQGIYPTLEDFQIGPLVYKAEGSIFYKQKMLEMRPQIKTLFIYFMNNHKNFIDYSTLKDELISAHKRDTVSSKTITKYVSELHKILKKHFKRKVIFNHKKEGYIFDIKENS